MFYHCLIFFIFFTFGFNFASFPFFSTTPSAFSFSMDSAYFFFFTFSFSAFLSLRAFSVRKLPSLTLGGVMKPKLLANLATSTWSVLKIFLRRLALKQLMQLPQAQKPFRFRSQLFSTNSRSLSLMPTNLLWENSINSALIPARFSIMFRYFLLIFSKMRMASLPASAIFLTMAVRISKLMGTSAMRTISLGVGASARYQSKSEKVMLVQWVLMMASSKKAFCCAVANSTRNALERWCAVEKITSDRSLASISAHFRDRLIVDDQQSKKYIICMWEYRQIQLDRRMDGERWRGITAGLD